MTRGALMRATAGVWEDGEGRVRRPSLERVAFVPERPYVPPGTLRHVVAGNRQPALSDAHVREILAMLDAERIIAHGEGLDVERDWVRLLSVREQALLSVAHLAVVRPHFAFVDNLGRTLGPDQFARVLRMFTHYEISYVVMGGADVAAPADLVLDLADDGRWTVQAAAPDYA
jgi:putative ATP-binding cassette transporter